MTFFLDLWHDLREKRLWPVAVGLLAAALAIPVIMLKPAEEVPQPAIVANADAAEELPAVQVDDSAPSGSKLETFSQRNPFRPLSDLEEEETTGSASAGSGGSGSSKASTAGASAGSTAGAGSSKGSSPSTSSGSGGGSSDPAIDPSGPSTQWFRYTADLKFGTPGSLKTYKDVEALTLLPNDETPAIVFMGVSDDAKSAIFFIADPAFTATGEGECNDKKNCRFVQLGIADGKNEHSFVSEDGSEQFDVKLLGLNRENISSSEAKGDATDSKGKPSSTIEQANDTFLPRLLYRPSVARETE
jgi:hypothetical protein